MSDDLKVNNLLSSGSETFDTSELQRLSTDPTITKHPNPRLHFSFRDPDELGEEETSEYVVESIAPARRTYPTSTDGRLRRSPKE